LLKLKLRQRHKSKDKQKPDKLSRPQLQLKQLPLIHQPVLLLNTLLK
jgi:hypothetical protein